MTQINTQQLIITVLGISLILLILLRYNQEVIIAIVSGLIGFLTNKTITTDNNNNNTELGDGQGLQNTNNTTEIPEGA